MSDGGHTRGKEHWVWAWGNNGALRKRKCLRSSPLGRFLMLAIAHAISGTVRALPMAELPLLGLEGHLQGVKGSVCL